MKYQKEKKREQNRINIMGENFLKLMTDTKALIQKVWRIPSRRNSKKVPLRHIILKPQKYKEKEKILKTLEAGRDSNGLL